ncbi:MAG: methylated-DNA--[protein]-cysteine S-methyltransferase [Bacteroidales bacterium]
MKIYRAYHETPLGWVEINVSEGGILSLLFENKIQQPIPYSLPDETHDLLNEAIMQLTEWFEGKRRSFSLPLAPKGTPFQHKVWEELKGISYGETSTYARIARRIGKPTAIRAVASAIGRNPLNIIIPCHRVLGSQGQLTGYGGELWRKAGLLRFEQENAGQCLRWG